MSDRSSNNPLIFFLLILMLPFRLIGAILGLGAIGIVIVAAIVVSLVIGLTAGINWGYLAIMILVVAAVIGAIYGAIKFIKSRVSK